MKKVWSLLSVCAMILTMLPAMALSASADYATYGDYKYYEYSDGTISISDYYGSAATLNIPQYINGLKVTSIGISAFEECPTLKSVSIPSTVTSVSGYSFEDCPLLQSISIPSSVTYIGSNIVKGCPKLTTITVSSSNRYYCTVNGAMCTKDKKTVMAYPAAKSATSYTIPTGATTIGTYAFYGARSLKSVSIPSTVTEIGAEAFCETGITGITLPSSVKKINYGAFYNCDSLKSLKISSGVTTIPWQLCYDCDALTTVTLPNKATSIESSAFASCDSLKTINIPTSANLIDYASFRDCASLQSIKIPASVRCIGRNAFNNCDALTTVTFASGVTTIEYSAFSDCDSLKSVTLPNSVTSMGTYVFAYCDALTSVTLPSGLTTLPDCTFYDCASMKTVTIPNGVTSIGQYALRECDALQSVAIPKSVKTVASGAFPSYYNNVLTDVYYGGTSSNWSSITFESGNESVQNATKHYNYKLFSDVLMSAWYHGSVQYVAGKGFITGYTDGTFRPANDMTRQDFVVVLARVSGANLSKYANSTGGFKDVKKGSYYAPAVAWAVDKGIVTGYNSSEFGVGDPLTREQVSTILYRFKKSPSVSNVSGTLSQFSDRGQISAYAKTAAAWAAKNGIITGKGTKFDPKGQASRAQIAEIIMRMDQKGMF